MCVNKILYWFLYFVFSKFLQPFSKTDVLCNLQFTSVMLNHPASLSVGSPSKQESLELSDDAGLLILLTACLTSAKPILFLFALFKLNQGSYTTNRGLFCSLVADS